MAMVLLGFVCMCAMSLCVYPSTYVASSAAAVNSLNGTELGGRRIAVREDREDRDVKQFVEGEEGAPPRRSTRGRGRGRGRGPRAPVEGEPSGFQVGGSSSNTGQQQGGSRSSLQRSSAHWL